MIKLLKILLVVFFFFLMAQDMFTFTQFDVEQLYPASVTTSAYTNQIFAYGNTELRGRLLHCQSEPVFQTLEGQPLKMYRQQGAKATAYYPVTFLSPGDIIKVGYAMHCDAGLIFIKDTIKFHLFNFTTFPRRYTVQNRAMQPDEFQDKLKSLSPDLGN